jgi:hypothetical protein
MSPLSGDWWWFRNEMAAKGVTRDVRLTQVAQGVDHNRCAHDEKAQVQKAVDQCLK